MMTLSHVSDDGVGGCRIPPCRVVLFQKYPTIADSSGQSSCKYTYRLLGFVAKDRPYIIDVGREKPAYLAQCVFQPLT